MSAPISKTEQIRTAWASGDKIAALSIASKFSDQSGDTKTMQRGWDARNNPDFYKQIGKEPEELTEKAFAVIERKFITPKAKKPVDHKGSNALIAKAITTLELAAPTNIEIEATKAEEPEAPAKPKPLGKRAAIIAAAQAGTMPTPPDFTAVSHKRFRAKLVEAVALAEAGDVAGLKAFEINPISSSRKAIARYRDLAVMALEAKASSHG